MGSARETIPHTSHFHLPLSPRNSIVSFLSPVNSNSILLPASAGRFCHRRWSTVIITGTICSGTISHTTVQELRSQEHVGSALRQASVSAEPFWGTALSHVLGTALWPRAFFCEHTQPPPALSSRGRPHGTWEGAARSPQASPSQHSTPGLYAPDVQSLRLSEHGPPIPAHAFSANPRVRLSRVTNLNKQGKGHGGGKSHKVFVLFRVMGKIR